MVNIIQSKVLSPPAYEDQRVYLQEPEAALQSEIKALWKKTEELQAALEAKEDEARREREELTAEFRRIREEDRRAKEVDTLATMLQKLLNEKEEGRQLQPRDGADLDTVDHIIDSKKQSAVPNVNPFAFAFVGADAEGYYARESGGRSAWLRCPRGLTEATYANNHVQWISGGPKGKYVLRTSSCIYSRGVPAGIPKTQIVLISFGQDDTLFVRLDDGRNIHVAIPPSLNAKLESIGEWNVKTVSFGPGMSWALTYGDGSWSTDGVHSGLNTKLHSLSKVKNIVLSPWELTHWFVEDGDGKCHYSLPTSWHSTIQSLSSK